MYSVDTSAFINPWRRTYPPDVFPPLWEEHYPGLIESGLARATDEVRIELERQDDELLGWARSQEGLFVPIDDGIQAHVGRILDEHPKLIDANAGRSGADPFVIALALQSGLTVVTEERARSLVNPKIPDVCAEVGVRCITVIELMREQGWQYR